MKPTKQQKLILNHDKCAVIIAAPGSGKTFVISQKIKSNLNELLDHEGIIAISYTNKASNELKNRSLSNGENPKSSFFGSIDKFNLSEIIIPFGKHLFGLPTTTIKIKKIESLNDEVGNNPFEWFSRTMTLEQLSKENLEVIKSHFLDGLIMIETIGLMANYILSNSIACENYIKSRYKYIYIDEYQDSGREQHQIFLKIKNLDITAVAVGDLNQSIYAFSGKDSKYLEELSNNKDFKFFKLDKNHRCHPSIINYSNYLINSATELIPTENNLIFFNRVTGGEIQVGKWIDELIIKIQKAFKIKDLNQIAILTRSNRTAEIINENLKTAHKYFITNEIDQNLNIWSSIFSNLLRFCFDSNFKFIEVIEVFTSYEKLSKSQLKMIDSLKTNIEKVVSLSTFDASKLKDDFINIAKIIAPESKNEESISLLDSVLADVFALKSYEPAKNDEINLMTLHKSKGLEFDIVIHLDLHKWVFPKLSPGPNNDFNNPVFENYKQDLNLHYVGITRARKGCFLVSSTKRTNYQNLIKNGEDSEFIWIEGVEDLRFRESE